jgi:hypothetical protein
MTGAPVNLNRVRKARARVAKKAKATENAVRFGQSKARKAQDETERAKARHGVDQHRLSED